jgi:hypothetical protein
MTEPILRRVSWPALARASGRQCGAWRGDERRSVRRAGPLRDDAERRLFAIGHEIADQTGAAGGEPDLRFGGVLRTSIHWRLLEHVLMKARMSGLGDGFLDPSITVHDPDIVG